MGPFKVLSKVKSFLTFNHRGLNFKPKISGITCFYINYQIYSIFCVISLCLPDGVVFLQSNEFRYSLAAAQLIVPMAGFNLEGEVSLILPWKISLQG